MTAATPGAAAALRCRVLVVGVGGQGVLTAARLLGEAAVDAGLPVVLGQLHGMSQRGGSVESSVLIGSEGCSFIPPGGADLLLGFEPLEVLRARPSLSKNTTVLLSSGRVVPYPLAQAGKTYPDLDGMLASLRSHCARVELVDGPALAQEAGDRRALNIAMLGALAGLGVLPLDEDALAAVIERESAAGRRDCNGRAFELGREATAA